MPQSNCYSRDELSDFLLGNLPDDASDVVASHLESCRNCEETVALLDSTQDPLISQLRERVEIDEYESDTVYQTALDRVQGLVSGDSDAGGRPDAAGGHPSSPGTSHPDQLREYRLLEKLGEGGMGTVYKAVHTKLGRTVALKLLPNSRMRDANALNRFEREIRAVGQIDHPGVVQGTDAGETDGTHFLVMEFVEGMDLSRLGRRYGPLPIADACELIRQAAMALGHAHERQLVHRDVKPSNLMLQPDGRVKVLDLGLALLAEIDEQALELTTTGQFVGTLDYVAPEQCDDSHDVDHRVDIYSLGATLYKLLCGEAPYERSGANSPLQRIKRWATLPIPPIGSRRTGMPDELITVIERMVAQEPAERFATAAEVAEALEPFAANSNLPELHCRAEQRPEPPGAASQRAHLPDVQSGGSQDVSGRAPKKRRGLLLAAGAVLLLGAAYVIQIVTDRGVLVIESSDPGVEVLVKRSGEVYDELQLEQGENKTSVRSGNYEIILQRETDGLKVVGGVFTLTRGEQAVVTITRKDASGPSVATAAPTAAPRYDEKTFDQWLAVARTDRNSDRLRAAIRALNALRDESNESQAARTILQITSRYNRGGRESVLDLAIQFFKQSKATDRVDELIDVIESGDTNQTLFALQVLNPKLNRVDPSGSPIDAAVQTKSQQIIDTVLPIVETGKRLESIYAIHLLAQLQPDTARFEDALWHVLTGTDAHVAVSAATVLVDREAEPEQLLPQLSRLAGVREIYRRATGGWNDVGAQATWLIGQLAPRSDRVVSLLTDIARDPKSALEHSDSIHRTQSPLEVALIALGNLGPPAKSAAPAIEQFLSDEDHDVAAYAKTALNKINRTATPTEPAEELDEPPDAPRYNGKTFGEWLAVARTERNPEQVRAAIKAIEALHDDATEAAAAQALLQIVSRSDSFHIAQVYESMTVFRNFESVDRIDELIQLLRTGNLNQKLFALQVLNPQPWRPSPLGYVPSTRAGFDDDVRPHVDRIIPIALQLIKNGQQATRIGAIDLIDELMPDAHAFEPTLWRALDDDDGYVVLAAARVLDRRNADPQRLLAALRPLAMPPATATPSEAHDIARSAVWNIGRLAERSDEALALLVQVLRDPGAGWRHADPQVPSKNARTAALKALGQLGARAESALPEIRKYAEDDDATVRGLTQQTLHDIKKALREPTAAGQTNKPESEVAGDTSGTNKPQDRSIKATYDGKTFNEWLHLAQSERNPDQVLAAVKALAALHSDGNAKRAVGAILEIVSRYDNGNQIVVAANNAYWSFEPPHVSELVTVLETGNKRQRLFAFAMLSPTWHWWQDDVQSPIRAAAEQYSERIVAAALPLLETGAREEKIAAFGLIVWLQQEEPRIENILWQVFADEDDHLAVRAASVLVKRGADPDRLLPRLRRLANVNEYSSALGGSYYIAPQAVSLIGLLADRSDQVVPLLVEIIEDPKSTMSAAAKRALRVGFAPHPKSARENALRVLGGLGAQAKSALPIIRKYTEERDNLVASYAIGALDSINQALAGSAADKDKAASESEDDQRTPPEPRQEGASSTHGTYNGKTFEQWLQIAQTERNPELFLPAVKALAILHGEANEKHVARATFEAWRFLLQAERSPLNTDKNPESISAMIPTIARLGRTGYAAEATQALIDVSSLFDLTQTRIGYSTDVLMLAVRWCQYLDSPKALDVLLNNLRSGDANRQHFVLRVVSYSGGGYDSRPVQKTVKANAKTVMPILLELTRSDDPGVAEQSLRIAYHVNRRDTAYVPRLLEAVSQSQHSGVYQTAARQLLGFETPPSNLIDVATERAKRGTYPERSTGVWMLGELAKRGPEAVSALIELIVDDSYDLPAPTPDRPKSAGGRRRRKRPQPPSLREYAITCLAQSGSAAKEAIPVLKELSADEELDRRVRQAATTALQKIESDKSRESEPG